QVCGRIALCEHRRRSVAVDRSVIRRQKNGNLPPRRFLEDTEKRGTLKPLTSDLAEGDLIARNFVEDLRFAASMCQQIDEVEDEPADTLASDRRSHKPPQ